MNKTQATVAVCEIELKNGSNCGVQAIGRCATCGRAFCLTHYAYANMCAPCFAETPAEVERAKKDEAYREQYALYQYFHSGSARTALFTSGVQPVEIYLTKEQFKPGPFGSGIGSRYVDVVTRGWILGEFRWELPPFVEYDSVWIKHEGKIWPIALLDLDNEALLLGKWEGLARVHRVPKGYEVLGTSPSRGRYERGVDQEGLKEIMQAIKRLTEESR